MYIYIGEAYDLKKTEDSDILTQWLEEGAMVIDTEDNTVYNHETEAWDDIEDGEIYEDRNDSDDSDGDEVQGEENPDE